MRSPFPGMDPYMERRWGDVHLGLCSCIRAALQPHLPAGLIASGQEDVRLAVDDGDADDAEQAYWPDVSVVEGAHAEQRVDPAGGRVATVEPIFVRIANEPDVRRWVEIIDTGDGDRVVTAIEVLSPSNKAAGQRNRDYRRKVDDYARARINLVEIDLLRTSRDRLAVPAVGADQGRAAAYYTCVRRANRRGYWEVYPMPLRDPLPVVPVPCRPTDPDVPLALQPVLDRVYAEGGHGTARYARPLDRPLSPADAAWAADLIANRTGPPPVA